MSDVKSFLTVLKNVHLNGINEGCVVTFINNTVVLQAMDMTSAIFTYTSCPFEHEDEQLGILDLNLFIKYLSAYADQDISLTKKENKLVIKVKGGGTTRYILSEVSFIPTYDEDWSPTDEIVQEEVASFSTEPISLKKEQVEDVLKLMGLFNPNSLTIGVSKKGAVSITGGKADTEHTFTAPIGKTDADPCDIRVYSKNIISVLNCLDYEKDPEIYIEEGKSIIITNGDTVWILSPLEIDE